MADDEDKNQNSCLDAEEELDSQTIQGITKPQGHVTDDDSNNVQLFADEVAAEPTGTGILKKELDDTYLDNFASTSNSTLPSGLGKYLIHIKWKLKF